jgi:bla regulator protein blaR1
MTGAWLLYCAFIAAPLAVAARAAESLGKRLGYPVRWIWACAMGLTLALAALAPFRAVPRVAGAVSMRVPVAAVATASPSAFDRLASLANGAGLLGARLHLDPRTIRVLTTAWITASAVLLVLCISVHARVRRARRRWPATTLLGVPVRVAPNAGPAVVGTVRPEIVVPSWLIERRPAEQRLVLAHELQHLRSHDPSLLTVTGALVVLVPWNPFVWWMYSRLRLAVELDCDARVLRAGAAPRAYGELLIDLAEVCSALRTGAPALTDDTSHLQQRLMAMKTSSTKPRLLRAGAAGGLAMVAVFAACEAKLPTADEVAQLDVGKAEYHARRSGMLVGDTIVYLVNGTVTTNVLARAIPAESIAAIDVRHETPQVARIELTTRGHMTLGNLVVHDQGYARTVDGRTREPRLSAYARREPKGDTGEFALRMRDGHEVGVGVARISGPAKFNGFTGLLLINGVRSDQAALNALKPADIESVEILKGVAARQAYGEPEAVNGVILIVTRGKGVRN